MCGICAIVRGARLIEAKDRVEPKSETTDNKSTPLTSNIAATSSSTSSAQQAGSGSVVNDVNNACHSARVSDVDTKNTSVESQPPRESVEDKTWSSNIAYNWWKPQSIEASLTARGPDKQHSDCIIFDNVTIQLSSSVLHLRGASPEQPTQQPVNDGNGNLLLWNGEVFGGVSVAHNENDTLVVCRLIGEQVATGRSVPDVVHEILGPYAFVYWQADTKCLWYGRDRIGRRSLVTTSWHSDVADTDADTDTDASPKDAFAISSLALSATAPCDEDNKDKTAEQLQWSEVATTGIQCIQFVQSSNNTGVWEAHVHHFAWPHVQPLNPNAPLNCASQLASCPLIDTSVLPFMRPDSLVVSQVTDDEFNSSVDKLYDALSNAVRVRVQTIVQPSTPDHARVAVLFSGGIDCTILAAFADKHLPPNEPIDLVNVVFVGEATPPEADREELDMKIPDRATAINSLMELRKCSPTRPWNLIEVDIRLADLEACRSHTLHLIHPAATVMDFNIASIMWFGSHGVGKVRRWRTRALDSIHCRYKTGEVKDLNEELEKLSLEAASIEDPAAVEEYASPTRVMLVGIGADEQCAGYGRHRTVFRKAGWDGLQKELNKDCTRLWLRNLGRDDRVISDSSREARHPFLDEEFMRILNETPLGAICNLEQETGIGDKRVLRSIGSRLGLHLTSSLQKRAIQFGSRIANPRGKCCVLYVWWVGGCVMYCSIFFVLFNSQSSLCVCMYVCMYVSIAMFCVLLCSCWVCSHDSRYGTVTHGEPETTDQSNTADKDSHES
jgi:asparagine synthetase B (glutamine-hydrolysing)